MKGWGKVYICIFDGPGLERGERSNAHNKRKTKTTAWDKGTAKKYKKSKKQNPATRKKQNPATRKKADRTGWGRHNKQSDAEILLDIQLRYETHGGEGFASPQKVILLCGNKTKFFIKNAKLGLKAVSVVKKKRWRDLPCF